MYPSLWQIIIVLVILLLLFGHKKIREFGKSLGEGLRDFKKGLDGDTNETTDKTSQTTEVSSSTLENNSSTEPPANNKNSE